ncbi:MAG: M28 family peptidase [Deltaproteobacteria bacterium]|nr:M28 family peptidase [Deltaproteobacteria bacterium]
MLVLALAPGCDGTADADADADAGGRAGGKSGGTDADAGGGVCEYPPEADGVPDFPAPDFDCADDAFSLTFAQGVIGTLAQSAWGGRKFGTPGLDAARDWIREQFACVGLTPGAPSLPGAPSGTFDQPFTTLGVAMHACDISGWSYVGESEEEGGEAHDFTNLVGSIAGSGDLAHEVIVVGAHMDHLGHYGVEGNQMVLGADDNASGILALLSLAKSLVESPPERADRRTVVFVAWGVEEDPFYRRGSRAFFEQLQPGAAEQIMYYVNFDMIGHYSDDGMLYALGTYEGSPAQALLEARAGTYGEVEIGLGERGESSDHVTFCENEIPYTFFWAENDCYHRPCDTPDAIDYDHLPDILRAGRDLVADLSVEPDLLTPRSSFASDYTAAYPELGDLAETCGFQEG